MPPLLRVALIGPFAMTDGKPRQVMVGKNAQSPITPIEAYTEKDVDIALLESLYIGADVLARATELKAAHNDWLLAWREQSTEANSHTYGTAHPPAATEEVEDPALIEMDVY